MIIIEDLNLTVILGYELWSLLKILIWQYFRIWVMINYKDGEFDVILKTSGEILIKRQVV